MKIVPKRKSVRLTVKVKLDIPVVDYLEIQEGTKTEINNQYRNYGLGVIREKLSGLDAEFLRVNLTKGENDEQ